MTQLSKEAIIVRSALEAKGLETPMQNTVLSSHEKKQQIEQHMTSIMNLLGLDLADDSLAETPHRIAKMYVDELSPGLIMRPFRKSR